MVDRAEGATVWDADGREYLDCFAGIAVVNAGHRHPKVIAAVHEQLERVVHAATYLYHVPVVADLAERLAEVTPDGLEKTFFGNSEGGRDRDRDPAGESGDGVRHEIITLTHSFHGRTAGTLSLTGNKARKTRGRSVFTGHPPSHPRRMSIGTRLERMIPRRWPSGARRWSSGRWRISRAAMSRRSSPSR